MDISTECLDLIALFEGFRADAYPDPVGVWTIGYGHTKGVRPGMRITKLDALKLLERDADEKARDVQSLLRRTPAQCQFDALVSFAFNVGSDIDADRIAEGLGDSTLLRKFNAGDDAGAHAEFGKWTHAGGKVLPGLVRRRRAEAAMFAGENWRATL